MKAFLRWADLPQCCKQCKRRVGDSKDEYSPTIHSCNLHLILPTGRQQCKKQISTEETQDQEQ